MSDKELDGNATLLGILGSLVDTDPDKVNLSRTIIRLLNDRGFTEEDAWRAIRGELNFPPSPSVKSEKKSHLPPCLRHEGD